MTRSMTNLFRLSIGTMLGAAVLLWNGQLPLDPKASLVSSAEARVGRPLTPMSYAGVARRTTRRAVAVGAVATGAAVVAAPVVVAPACAQVVDAYGRIPPSADKRETQIVAVIEPTVGMVGDLQAIAGKAMPEITSLDTPMLEGPGAAAA